MVLLIFCLLPVLSFSSSLVSFNPNNHVANRRLLQGSCGDNTIVQNGECVCDVSYYQSYLSGNLSSYQFPTTFSALTNPGGAVFYHTTTDVQIQGTDWYGHGSLYIYPPERLRAGSKYYWMLLLPTDMRSTLPVLPGGLYEIQITMSMGLSQFDISPCYGPITDIGLVNILWREGGGAWQTVFSQSLFYNGILCDQDIKSATINPTMSSIDVLYRYSDTATSHAKNIFISKFEVHDISPTCISCPSGYTSDPGALAVSSCYVKNGIELNFTIDDADVNFNQTVFDSRLPSNVHDLLYSDEVVIYLENCPTGYYCVSDTTKPAPCPAGLYRDTTGATQLSDCIICPVGYYCPIATTHPTQCPAGTYRGSTGAKQPTDCTTCNSGNYCPLGSIDPVNCSTGTYRASTGAASQTDCIACPQGEYCGVATTTPIPCAAGTYRPDTSGVTQDDCQICPAGHYCPIQSITPTNCPAGTYVNTTGSSLLSHCLACTAGNYCPVASHLPTPCAAGSYRTSIGGESQSSCTTCPKVTVLTISSHIFLFTDNCFIFTGRLLSFHVYQSNSVP